jgi:hypothetical protein
MTKNIDIHIFLQKDNINTLWDVITDEDIFKFLSRDIQNKISETFLENLKGFFHVESKKTNNLIDMNKKYILLILNFIKTNFPQKLPNKIKIFDDIPVKELITYEEIQNEKISQFDKDLTRRKEEFSNSMTLAVPEVPSFADNFTDEPISEMDKIIKEMTLKRNYDVEQINNNYKKDDSWLKPQETSIKNEKFTNKLNNSENVASGNRVNNYNNKFKYLNFENSSDNNSDNKSKNVTWGDNKEIDSNDFNNQENIEENIFRKLKRIEQPNTTLTFNEKSVEERLTKIENTLESFNSKIDSILELFAKLNKS